MTPVVPQPPCEAQLVERGCTALSAGASASRDQQTAAVTLCSHLQASSPQCWCLAWKRQQKLLLLLALPRVNENSESPKTGGELPLTRSHQKTQVTQVSLLRPLLHFTPRVANSGQELAKGREQQQHLGWSLRCAFRRTSFRRVSLTQRHLPFCVAELKWHFTEQTYTLCVWTKTQE